MRSAHRIALLAGTLLAWLLVACAARADDLLTVAAKTPELSTLVKLIQAADLGKTLQERGPYTLLAPNDDAFARLPKGQVDDLMKPENVQKLRALLLYHIIGARFRAADFGGISVGSKGPTLNGATLTLTSVSPPVFNGMARIVKTDLVADNGIIQVIDAVLTPPIPRPVAVAPLTLGRKGDALIGTETLAALAAKTPQLSTLYDLLKTAGLDETLEKRGPFTVFAPTNAAFAKIGGGVERLKDPQNRAQLLSILMYHLVPGKYAAADLTSLDGTALATADRGASLTVSAKDGVHVNGAKAIQADVAAKNGILHLIDTVLVPPK